MELSSSTAELERRARYQHNILNAPINRLPDDMLVEVFRQALPGHRPAKHRYLATIIGICSLWRQVAVNTPLVRLE